MSLATDSFPELRPCQRSREIEALLGTLSPASLAAAPLQAYSMFTPYPWVVAVAIAVMLLQASVFYAKSPTMYRLVASLALLGWTSGNLYEHLDNPFRGLFLMLSMISLLFYIWPAERLRQFNVLYPSHTQKKDILIASGIAIFVGLDHWLLLRGENNVIQTVGFSATYLAPLIFWARYHKRNNITKNSIQFVLASIALVPAVSRLAPFPHLALDVSPLGIIAPVLLFLIVARQSFGRQMQQGRIIKEPRLLDEILVQPSRILVLSFLVICVFGTLLLSLPIAAVGDNPHAWLDAIFTSVSATCVTGLIVLDTPHAFSPFGQFVILCLIQVGGLGIMVFSAAAIAILGRRLSFSHERAAVDIVGASNRASLYQSIRLILLVTLVTELISAVALSVCFYLNGDSLGQAIWRGVFTAISAFCNAGFALQSDSLMVYADQPVILLIISLTIIIGGLGPVVVVSTWQWRSRRNLHSRLVLWSSGVLILLPGLFIVLVEWHGVLSDFSILNKISNGLFQSVTLRTAGFNSVDLSLIHPSVWTLMIVLMFIGGSPASTAGGIKTTTVAVILIAAFAVIKGNERVEIFGRTLPKMAIIRATVVATLALIGAGIALTTLQLTQVLSLEQATFEVVSALATVGLSQGATAQLDEIGKIIIIACMFAGRVGPLTLFVFLSSNIQKKPARQLPEESIPIG